MGVIHTVFREIWGWFPVMQTQPEIWVACRGLTESHSTGQRGVHVPTTWIGRGYVIEYKTGKTDVVWCKDWDDIPPVMPMWLSKGMFQGQQLENLKDTGIPVCCAWF